MEKQPEVNFETALSELEQIVRQLEEGKVGLEESITAYEKGTSLRLLCESKLKNARLKVEKIVKDSEDGSTATQPFDAA